jgi:hypothetical protein
VSITAWSQAYPPTSKYSAGWLLPTVSGMTITLRSGIYEGARLPNARAETTSRSGAAAGQRSWCAILKAAAFRIGPHL